MTAPRRATPAVLVAAVLLVMAACGEDPADQPSEPAASAEASAGADPGCEPVQEEPAGDTGRHLDGPIAYEAAPPSYGDHSSRWEVRARSFDTEADRPDVEKLVHNLEHGYNILWYDQSVAEDPEALDRLREVAEAYATLGGERDPATAFIAVPWTSEDGSASPDGTPYAFTHWYADPEDRTRSRADEVGLTQYCAGVSAELVQQWMDDYPLRDAPEGYPDLM